MSAWEARIEHAIAGKPRPYRIVLRDRLGLRDRVDAYVSTFEEAKAWIEEYNQRVSDETWREVKY